MKNIEKFRIMRIDPNMICLQPNPFFPDPYPTQIENRIIQLSIIYPERQQAKPILTGRRSRSDLTFASSPRRPSNDRIRNPKNIPSNPQNET